jgi:hypothetical protein
MEICLLDSAFIDGDCAPQGCAQAVNDATFDLLHSPSRIDDLDESQSGS